MTKDIHQYCSSCPTCQRINPRMSKQRPDLHPIGVDLVGPLPETARGNKYIITARDYFSKWSEAAPLPDKTAIRVANFLFLCFAVMDG